MQSKRQYGVTNWQIGQNYVGSLGVRKSRANKEQDHVLQYIPEKEVRTERPLIPASFAEKMSYYRAYAGSICKNNTLIFAMNPSHFNRFLWEHILHSFLKCIPYTYNCMFLAAYAPDEHFFLSKMVPISYGFILTLIICEFTGLTVGLDALAFLLDFSIRGLFLQNPWNRCIWDTMTSEGYNKTVKCYELDKFIQVTQNGNVVYDYTHGYYTIDNQSLIHLAPVVYFTKKYNELYNYSFYESIHSLYLLIVWIPACVPFKLLYKKQIWKLFNKLHMAIVVIYMIIILHLGLDYILDLLNGKSKPKFEYPKTLGFPFVMYLEEPIAAPLLHILTSRSVDEIQPNRDSTLVVISNILYYILSGFMHNRLKIYCEGKIRAPMIYGNRLSFFYYWSIYFSSFYLGDLLSISFFFLHFLSETLNLILTFQCLMEVIVWQFSCVNRVAVGLVLAVLGSVWLLYANMFLKFLTYMTIRYLVMFVELFLVYIMYPNNRLIEDITFFYGTRPPKLRIVSFHLIPLIYLTKLFHWRNKLNWRTISLAMYVICVPFFIGIIYKIYINIWKYKKNICSLFRPDPDWGGVDHRELRKKYHSQEYIRSQAPKDLSYHMYHKAEFKVYNLDIRYDLFSRKSTFVKTENERKTSQLAKK